MKKSLVMVSLVAASTSMMAMDLQYFLGAGATRVDADSKTTVDYSIDGESGSYSETDSFKDTGLSLKTGVILNKNHRISIAYSNYSKEEIEAIIITGNYDYLIPLSNDFKLYTGLHIGNTELKMNDEDVSLKASGLVYGAQVGAIYDITKNIEFELGLAYSKYNVDKTISLSEGSDNADIKIELEDSTSMFAGINYKF